MDAAASLSCTRRALPALFPLGCAGAALELALRGHFVDVCAVARLERDVRL